MIDMINLAHILLGIVLVALGGGLLILAYRMARLPLHQDKRERAWLVWPLGMAAVLLACLGLLVAVVRIS